MWEVTRDNSRFRASEKGEFHHARCSHEAVMREDEELHEGRLRDLLLIGQPTPAAMVCEVGRETGLM